MSNLENMVTEGSHQRNQGMGPLIEVGRRGKRNRQKQRSGRWGWGGSNRASGNGYGVSVEDDGAVLDLDNGKGA